MYKILPYTFKQAIKHNVQVRPSTKRNKKIDVFKNNKKIASVGAIGYNDYPTFLKQYGKKYADERKRLYKIRHSQDRKRGAGYWADVLLW